MLDVPAIDKVFDYSVPDRLARHVKVGSRVRVPLGPRRVGGWVVEEPAGAAPDVALRPISSVSGLGPPEAVLELAGWAAWRWAGRSATFMRTASPNRVVRALAPPGRAAGRGAASGDPRVDELFSPGTTVLRLPPASDADRYAEAVATRLSQRLERDHGRNGQPSAAPLPSALVLAPSQARALELSRHLDDRGFSVALMPDGWDQAAAGGSVIVGTRAAAWAPAASLACVLVLDAHDEAYKDERSPTWNACEVAAERAARDGAPCVLATPCPSLQLLELGELAVVSRSEERSGWPPLEIVDRRKDDPRSGLLSERLVSLLRAASMAAPVVCVLNRKGRAQLLACTACSELARCEVCEGAMAQAAGAESLRCRRCNAERPPLCAVCGSQRLKVVRPGVSQVRAELEALARSEVNEVTGDRTYEPAPVLVGTEALLHRAPRARAVVFVDFDQELLAHDYRASERALALLARAARVTGGRDHASSGSSHGRLVVQTRLPGHEVLDAALHADPGRLARREAAVRQRLRLPPFTAMALVSGEAATKLVELLRDSAAAGLEVIDQGSGRWALRAPSHRVLCDALASVPRPAGRLRVEVDPMKL